MAMRQSVLLLSFLLLSAGSLRAQELEETLSQLGEAYAKAYTRPLADALGANLNTGLYDAPIGSSLFGFQLYVGVHAFGALLPEESEAFDLVFEGHVDLDAQVGGDVVTVHVPAVFVVNDAPALFGAEEPAVATITARYDTTVSRFGIAVPVSFDTTFTREIVGGLLTTNVVPAAAPHLRIGTVFGTDLMIRWLPNIEITDFGAVEMFGFGVRHSVSQYLPILPVDLAVQVAWQRLNAEDTEGSELISASTFAGSLALSRRVGVLTVYGGLQTERSTLDVTYAFDAGEDVDPIPIAFDLVGAVTARGTAGFGLHLGPLRLHADYSVGRVNVFSTGLGLAW